MQIPVKERPQSKVEGEVLDTFTIIGFQYVVLPIALSPKSDNITPISIFSKMITCQAQSTLSLSWGEYGVK